jgi:hypothetical protein
MLCIHICEQRIGLSMDINKFHLELVVNLLISSNIEMSTWGFEVVNP